MPLKQVMDFSHIPHDGPFLFGFTTGDDMPSRDPVIQLQLVIRIGLGRSGHVWRDSSGAVAFGSVTRWVGLGGAASPRHCAALDSVQSVHSGLYTHLAEEAVCRGMACAGHQLCYADVPIFDDAPLRHHAEVDRAAAPTTRNRESQERRLLVAVNLEVASGSVVLSARLSPSNALEPVAMVLTDLGALTLKQRRALSKVCSSCYVAHGELVSGFSGSSFHTRAAPVENNSPGIAIC